MRRAGGDNVKHTIISLHRASRRRALYFPTPWHDACIARRRRRRQAQAGDSNQDEDLQRSGCSACLERRRTHGCVRMRVRPAGGAGEGVLISSSMCVLSDEQQTEPRPVAPLGPQAQAGYLACRCPPPRSAGLHEHLPSSLDPYRCRTAAAPSWPNPLATIAGHNCWPGASCALHPPTALRQPAAAPSAAVEDAA